MHVQIMFRRASERLRSRAPTTASRAQQHGLAHLRGTAFRVACVRRCQRAGRPVPQERRTPSGLAPRGVGPDNGAGCGGGRARRQATRVQTRKANGARKRGSEANASVRPHPQQGYPRCFRPTQRTLQPARFHAAPQLCLDAHCLQQPAPTVLTAAAVPARAFVSFCAAARRDRTPRTSLLRGLRVAAAAARRKGCTSVPCASGSEPKRGHALATSQARRPAARRRCSQRRGAWESCKLNIARLKRALASLLQQRTDQQRSR
jgi:hypothetical protein